MSLRVGVAQFQPRASYEHCVSLLVELLSNVAMCYDDQTRPELLLLPELFLGGYQNSNLYHEHAIDVQASLRDETSTLGVICAAAEKNNLAVCFGYCEKVLGAPGLESPAATTTTYYNSSIFIGADGKVKCNARKTHLWGDREKEFFAPGESLAPVFTYRGVQIGMLICFDVEFPETCRTLRQRGAQLILVPTALVSKINALITVPSRAAENGIFIAYANEVGQTEDSASKVSFKYCGRSCLVGPDGEDVARCAAVEDGKDEDEVRTGTVTMSDPKYVAAIARNPYLECLRPELYGK